MLKIKSFWKSIVLALAGVAALVIAIFVVIDALVTSPQETELAAAQARWEERPISHYRLVSEISGYGPSIGTGCQQDLEIQNEGVINVFRNDCPDWVEVMTVTDIFRRFGGNVPPAVRPTPRPGIPPPTPYIPLSTPTGGPKTCPIVIVASFDPQFGYPHSIETQRANVLGCVVVGGASVPVIHKVKVLSLTPLPTLNVWQITPSPTSPTSIPPTPTPLTVTQPLIINGTSYPVPTDHNRRCIASGQTGANTVEYDVDVPDGWVVIWDSWQAYWPGGQYEDGGVLHVSGPWEGAVKIVNGQYCAFPSVWSDFRPNGPMTAVPTSKQCFVGPIENSGCANK